MNDFNELIKEPNNQLIKEWKQQGKKVIGYHCSYVPEEIIYAAGALPYRIRPVGCTEVPLANVYMTAIHCTFARGCLEFILKGEFDFLDGIVFMSSCDHMRRIYDICEAAGKHFPFMYFLNVPYKISDGAVGRYKDEIIKLKHAIEVFQNTPITEEKLTDAIDDYNQTRSLLKQLYELRRQDRPPVTGSEAMAISTAATVAPKREFNQILAKTLPEISSREGLSEYRARLMIIGSALEDPSYLQIVEEQGGLVCTDNLCFGSRYFEQPVQTDGDLLGDLAESYLTRPCCPRIVNELSKKNEYLERLVSDYKVEGVMHQRIRYCDLHGGDLLLVRKKLKEMNIPLLELEREYWLSGVGQLKTRIQAFIERIETGR